MSKWDWKRKKWLLKNLTIPQLVKYLCTSKPIISSKDNSGYNIIPYEVNMDIEVDNQGTMLIKPSGIRQIKNIVTELQKANISITKCVKISNYRKYARSVFYMVPPEEQNIWFLILDTYYTDTCNEAVLLYLDKKIEEVAKFKQGIRKKIGIDFFRVQKNFDSYITSLTPVHSSSRKERIYEECVIQKMLSENEAEMIEQTTLLGMG